MEFSEYQERAWFTAVYPGVGNNFVYPTLGLMDEVGELYLAHELPGPTWGQKRAAVIKEAGDVLWYVACLCSELNIDLQDVALYNTFEEFVIPTKFESIRLFFCASVIAGKIKKAVRDTNGIIPHDDMEAIKYFLLLTLRLLLDVCDAGDITLNEVAEKNLEKLADRRKRNRLHGSGDDR